MPLSCSTGPNWPIFDRIMMSRSSKERFQGYITRAKVGVAVYKQISPRKVTMCTKLLSLWCHNESACDHLSKQSYLPRDCTTISFKDREFASSKTIHRRQLPPTQPKPASNPRLIHNACLGTHRPGHFQRSYSKLTVHASNAFFNAGPLLFRTAVSQACGGRCAPALQEAEW